MARAWVIVLGDVGRSPRMQYHTSSLCKTDEFTSVHLIGYRGAAVIDDLQAPLAEGRLTLNYIPGIPPWLSYLPRPLALPLKAIFQLFALLWMLLISLPRPDVILLQLPPALPTMVACWMAARRHGARLVFDWHNFAYTLMAINMGRGHPLVGLAERYERYWAKASDGAFCVTKAMQQELSRGWGVEATVFYDRPPEFFRPATVEEMHALFIRLNSTLRYAMHPHDFVAAETVAAVQGGGIGSNNTLVTTTVEEAPAAPGAQTSKSKAPKSISLCPDQPAIVVTSTSWTPDEDFSLLLQAAQIYDIASLKDPANLPRLLIFVTGRGPQRSFYKAEMQRLNLQRVAFRTAWLEPGDYPLLLGSADLGVSLHASSSGLDLPMKVVDMFGCGLPVCALSYSCISELVQHGRNGLLFATGEELADRLQEALRGFNGESEKAPKGVLAELRRGLASSGFGRWHENWKSTALPVLLQGNVPPKQQTRYHTRRGRSGGSSSKKWHTTDIA